MVVRWVNVRVLVHEWLIEESDLDDFIGTKHPITYEQEKQPKNGGNKCLGGDVRTFFFRFVKWIFLKDHQTFQAPKMKGSSPIEAVWIWPM